ncbi:DeoR family fructose operon transcriptional repressor [Geomicrobium halophilum]|uniref:DeoR family fructose operon transcriptional repressor n=1 Tax=Geomicrobium halophilum TaxID=549000 RepID=A0A841PLI8_9BACL|nr:DeoR/GlpR family DNA-binding transcription regulator [Geomicrobium halophilum]MBB6449630.1 DeoR family fructose operon transcriptional repressor [Geomicrobium halophilum]
MLHVERRAAILRLLLNRETVTIQQLIDETHASESTIRRDLIELEKEQQIKRVHGGASLEKKRKEEPTVAEKTTQNREEKQSIARYAAELVENKECIFLDAGTTTFEMIPFLADKGVIVVTTGTQHVQRLIDYSIETYVPSGRVKTETAALIGSKAMRALSEYRFDRCFLGMNGVHDRHGYTTPDPEEAIVKETVLTLGAQSYVLADHTKLEEVSFATVSALDAADLILSDAVAKTERERYQDHTEVRTVVL